MAGAACKVVINNGLQALTRSVERILTDPDIHMERVPEEERLLLIQRLADCDLATYSTEKHMPDGGVAAILKRLEKWGVVTAEVWEIYRRPD